MKNETMEYLLQLQENINKTESIYIEPSEDFNRGYLIGKQLTINDVINAIRKIEGL